MIEKAKQVLQNEADAILRLKELIDEQFTQSLELIFHAKGRIVVTGIGKSAIIAQKMVATFNSTGTPAIFMHAAEAIHGDLGIIQPDDVVICLSKSGNTPEISVLMPFLKRSGNKIIAIVGNPNSFLAREADYVINCAVEKEACPNNLAPTSSSTAQMAIGDALAACLIEMRGFTAEDFAKYHPGGILGKRLYTTVKELYQFNQVPAVQYNALMKEVIFEISSKMLGITAVLKEGKLIGCITDGDLRRMLERYPHYDTLTAEQVMSPNPKTIHENILAAEALELMKQNSITSLFVVDQQNQYIGVIHLHNIIKEGIY